MSGRGVWLLDLSGDIVASGIQADEHVIQRLRREARDAYNSQKFSVEFCPGGEQWIELFPIRSSQFSGVVGVWDDRQPQKDLELEIESLAHDINNLLAVTQGHLEMLKDVLERVPASLTEALWVLERAENLVHRLGDVPRPRAGESTACATAVEETLTHLASFLHGGRYAVQWDVRGPVPAAAVDSADFVEIFQNLLQNACESMADGGPITIHIRPSRETVVISVRDAGVGMTAEDMDRVFQPYFTTKQRGHGLGLYRTRQLVEKYHGRIQVISSPGKGANFVVTLPSKADAQNPPKTRTGGFR